VGILLTLAWRNLWRHPRRTLLTAAAVALGLALVLVFLGLQDGQHSQMIESAVRMGSGHVLIQAPGYQRRRGVEMVVSEPAVARVRAWATVGMIGGAAGVEAVLPRAFVSGLLSSADGATGVNLIGIDAAAEAPVSRLASRVREGRFLAPADRGLLVVGRGVARVLRARPGTRVVLMAQGARGGEIRSALFRVVGVLETGLDQVDEALALVPLPSLQAFLGLDGGVHQVALILRAERRAAAVARAARGAFPGLEALTWAEADPQLEAFIKIDDGGTYVFDAIFFVLIAFTLLNTLLMAVLERRREIALLGALGLSAGRRLALVLLEALMLAVVATAAGLGLGLLGHTYFRLHGLPLAWFTSRSVEAAGVMLDPVFYSVLSLARVAGVVGLVLLLTLGLSLIAARHAAKPVDPHLLKAR
jgi:ABC-type lipoprotein release transport system permease subunit